MAFNAKPKFTVVAPTTPTVVTSPTGVVGAWPPGPDGSSAGPIDYDLTGSTLAGPLTGASRPAGWRLLAVWPSKALTNALTINDSATTGGSGGLSFAAGFVGATFGPDGVWFNNGIDVENGAGDTINVIWAPGL